MAKKKPITVVRSIRFRRDQWDRVEARSRELGIQAGTFVRNASLVAAGAPTESEELRDVADALDRVANGLAR